MYTSFSIENFRLFDQLTVEPLARVNLIAGQNNVGKTALLEALCLHGHPGHPELAHFVSVLRGLPGGEPGEFFSDFFHKYQAKTTIKFDASGDWGADPRTLTIRRQPRTEFSITLGTMPSSRARTSMLIYEEEMAFDYCDETNKSLTARVWAQETPQLTAVGPVTNSVQLQSDVNDPGTNSTPVMLMSVTGRVGDLELAAEFGKAVREGHLPMVEEAVRVLEPRLHGLVAVPNELGSSLIYADTGENRKMPISVMGSGINRILAVTLAFLRSRGAVLLIDEVENGLHYRVLNDVWKTLDWLSRHFNVQVFATTHSYECIYAAHSAFKEQESTPDFAFFRLQRNYATGSIECVAYDDIESFDYAMKYGKEVR